MADADQTVRDVEELSRGSHGLIRISTAITFGRMHLLPAVNDFLMLNPSIQIEVTLSERFADLISGNLRSNVAEGLIDAAIAGLGVAALPSFAIAPSLASGQLVALLTDYQLPESTLYAVFLPDRRLP